MVPATMNAAREARSAPRSSSRVSGAEPLTATLARSTHPRPVVQTP
jgi:hypothetical protein